MKLSQNDQSDWRTNLGRQVRALAHDAAEALSRIQPFELDTLETLIPRIDELREELADRTSTDIYRWLSSLRQLLSREIETHRASNLLDEGEGSGTFDAHLGVGVR